MIRERNVKRCVLLLMLCVLLPIIPAGSIQADDYDWPSAEYNGNTYFYRNTHSLVGGSEDLVEIIGIVVPEGTLELKIPKTLGGKKVINLDLFKGIQTPTGEIPKVKKIFLSKNIRPMKVSQATGNKYFGSGFFGEFYYLESIKVAKGSKYLKTKDGVLYNKDMSTMLEYPLCKRAEEYKMPSSVTWSTGIGNDYLKKIIFSNNKKYKRAHMSWCENLESVYFPDNIKEIDGCYGAVRLKTIRWSKNLEIIGDRSFENAVSLTELKLPDRVREIGAGAFRWCRNVKKVILPESMGYVGKYAFAKVPGIKKVKKASYLLSPQNNKVRGKVPDSYKYVAVVTLITGKEKRYYDSQRVYTLKPSQKQLSLKTGRAKTVSINPGIAVSTASGFRKGSKMKTDILSFTSSDPKVAKVTKKGRIKGLKKGEATIMVCMKTTDVKCNIKVTVN